MKRRNSFITNSSSCSFILIGVPQKEDPGKDKYGLSHYIEDEEGGDFYPTNKAVFFEDIDETLEFASFNLKDILNKIPPEDLDKCKIIIGTREC
jgi:hypothetical protein